jgi:hypothetical protein
MRADVREREHAITSMAKQDFVAYHFDGAHASFGQVGEGKQGNESRRQREISVSKMETAWPMIQTASI